MTSVIEMDIDSPSGRHLYFIPLTALEEWPADVRFSSRHFVLFLAGDARPATDEALLTFALTVLDQGLAYLCAWGADCGRVEKLFDHAIATTRPDETEDSVVLTTSHPEETLEQTLWYFLNVAWPAADYDETCRSLVAVAVGSKDWARSVRNRLADPAALAREIEQRDQ